MVADQTRDPLATHQVRHEGAHVAALGDVTVIAEAVHQLRPRAQCGQRPIRASAGSADNPYPGQGRQHQVERIFGATAVRSGPSAADRLEQLDDRAGPAVGHDQRQRVLVSRRHVDEVILTPSISVVNCGRAFSLAPIRPKSYSVQ